MANKNFNTQTRKMFDNGTEKPSKPSDSSTGKGIKSKRRSIDPNSKIRIGDGKRKIRKKFPGGLKQPKDLLDRNPSKSLSPETKKRLRDAIERRRQFNKKRKLEKQELLPKRKEKTGKAKQPIGKLPLKKEPLRKPRDKKMERRTKELEKRQFGKTSEDKKPKKNTIKDKINKVGNMKVKDAAKAVGKGILAGTPIGSAKNIADAVNKNFKFQSPIVRKNKKFGGR
mgnify:FL=1